MAYIVIITVQ